MLAWTLAWGVMGVALHLSGVFNSPRTGPLWLALAGGAIPWALAGYRTWPMGGRQASARRRSAILLVWAFAYLLAFGMAAYGANKLDPALGGFFWVLLGWSLGGAAGAFISTWLSELPRAAGRSVVAAAIWMLGFLVGAYVALVGLYLGPELAKLMIGPVMGVPAALTLGAGLGCALGGLVAALISVGLARLAAGRR